ncbi:helix-turn-helix domain-containing protein, partial [Candidatus Aerophobetes bacterium]|nr:helix-turn-helix domain-containing protein [Candidatus Aerophobetes bacterium]
MKIFYQEIQKMKRVEARKKLIETYKKTKSISKTAKLSEKPPAMPKRKWLRRYKEKGEKGLEDLPRRPKRP